MSLILLQPMCYESCDGTLQSLPIGGTGAYTYQWSNNSALQNIAGLCGTIDTMEYSLIVTDANECTAIAFDSIVRPDSIRAIIEIPEDTFGFTPFLAEFVDSSYGAYDNVYWVLTNNNDPADVQYFDQVATVQTILEPNNNMYYTMQLLVIKDNNFCPDSTSRIIFVEASPMLEVPDVFTPNDDDVNDKFMVSYRNICKLKGMIFNRWGEKLYQWSGVETSWDGRTLAGEEVSDRVYFYIKTVAKA
ncbi:MAG: gliding motility-associated C-terminal domain-containing protein [Flavobacteriales bacterium]|nr:gliding motility-associated C-terminal domain-containing protein [Flavobacteriales bacterium]